MGTPSNGKEKSAASVANRIIGVISKMAYFALILLVIVLVIAVVKSQVNHKSPSVFGYQMYNVLSHSMDGTKRDSFNVGSLILVKSIDPNEIKEGDIITYDRRSKDSKLTTHRVVKINTDVNGELSFTTQGDTNPSPDGTPVPENIVLGKVIGRVPLLGFAVSFMQTKKGIVFFVFIPLGLIVVCKSFNIIKSLKDKRKKSENNTSNPETKQIL